MFRLALEFRRVDVDRFANEITVQQLRRWKAYYLSEPFGCDWQRTARLAAWISATMGAKVADDTEDRFLPTYKMRPQTDAEIEAELSKIPWLRKSNGDGDR